MIKYYIWWLTLDDMWNCKLSIILNIICDYIVSDSKIIFTGIEKYIFIYNFQFNNSVLNEKL